MIKKIWVVCCIITVIFTVCASSKVSQSIKSVSPYSFGLLKAKTGEERFNVLLQTHKYANQNGLSVDYSGIHKIDLIIPKGAESIPLSIVNDFANVVFNVTNKTEDCFLFSYVNKSVNVDVAKHLIDRRVFTSIKQLKSGTVILSIADENPWIENRKGYNYGHIREDVLLIKKGKAQNKTVLPYGNVQSKPICKAYRVEYPYLSIENITLIRAAGCTSKTYLCNIVGTDNVQLKNVSINTIGNDLVDDKAIRIENCTNVSFETVKINGTYSRSNHSGYGICMNNVWNFKATNLSAFGSWGVFGNNNMNEVSISDSEINRFDVHCYGKNIGFHNVCFRNLYNQFSSVFGIIEFDNCTFDDFVPVLYEPSYDVQNQHNIVFKNCVFTLSKSRNYLVALNSISEERSIRPELYEKCWPGVTIENMRVIVTDSTTEMDLFLYPKGGIKSVDRILDIDIEGMDFDYKASSKPIDMYVSNESVSSKAPVKININELNLNTANQTKSDYSIETKGNFITNIQAECISSSSSVTKSRITNSLLFE